MNNFINVLEDLLEEKAMSIQSLSEELKIHKSILYAYKNNNYLPSVNTAVNLANYFDCSVNYLMGIDTDKKEFHFTISYDISKFYKRYNMLLNNDNITHYKLCNITKLNKSSLDGWKKGKTPKMDSLIKIAKYFDVSVDYLIGRSDKQ